MTRLSKVRSLGLILVSLTCTWMGQTAFAGPNSFSFRMRAEAETLDWNRAHTDVEASLLSNLMEGLVTFDATEGVAPALAEKWTLSSDGTVYTFKLRRNVKWSDGVPLKAKDFVYSWKRLLSPLTAASYAYFLFDVQGAEDFNRGKLTDFDQVGVKAIDDFTLEVTLTHPVAHWIYIPAFWVTFPLRQDVVESTSGSWTLPGRMVTLGPFTLWSHDLDSKFVMKENPTYYGRKGNIKELTALIVKDDAEALRLYEQGKLDFISEIGSIHLKRMKGRPELKMFPYYKTGFLGFVIDKYPVSNVRLRRAIAMAIDRSKLVGDIYSGQVPATSFVPQSLFGYSKTIGLGYHPDLARKEILESGLDLSKPITIEFALSDGDKSIATAQSIEKQLESNLKISVVLRAMENTTFRKQLDLYSYPLFANTWTADYPDPDTFLSLFESTSGNGKTRWKNDEYDGIVRSARKLQDQKKREALYLKAQKILLEREAVIVPLYYSLNWAMIRPNVKGYRVTKMGFLYFRNADITR